MYRAEILNKHDYVFNVKSGNHGFTIDIKGEGITPPDALLASLGSCAGVYIRKYIESAKLELKEFAIVAEAEFCKDSPIRFKDINVSIDLKGVKLGEQREKALMEFVKNCPVHNTLKNNPSVEIKII